jgi:hypothetical protein
MFFIYEALPMSQQPPSSNRSRRILSRLAISLVTVFFTLFVIELAVRVVPLYPDKFELYDPDRGWVSERNKTGMFFNVGCLAEFRSRVTTNSHGLHDVEHSYDKPPDTYRILIVGDSTVASFEVPLEQAFFRLLESQLNNGGDRHYEIIGGGFRGYGTDLELIYYEQEGRRYQSDMVILLIQPGNDIHDNHPALRTRSERQYIPYFTLDENGELIFHHPSEFAPPGEPGPPYINLVHNTLLNISRLYRLVYERLGLYETARKVVDGGNQIATPQDWDEAWAVTRALIARMREEVEQDGARFAVVVADGSFRTPEEGEDIHQRLNAILDELGAPYLNMRAAFDAQESTRGPLHFVCDPHWNTAGHALAAEEMAAYLPGLIAGES